MKTSPWAYIGRAHDRAQFRSRLRLSLPQHRRDSELAGLLFLGQYWKRWQTLSRNAQLGRACGVRQALRRALRLWKRACGVEDELVRQGAAAAAAGLQVRDVLVDDFVRRREPWDRTPCTLQIPYKKTGSNPDKTWVF